MCWLSSFGGPIGCSLSFDNSQASFQTLISLPSPTVHPSCLTNDASHQNLVSGDWIHLHRDWGSLKQLIAYAGIAARTLLSITSFPTPERSFVDQLAAFSLIFSTMEVNISFLDLPNCSGSPRKTLCHLQIEDDLSFDSPAPP